MQVTKIPVGRYRHYKGQEYEVIGEASHTETGEVFVVYRALYGDRNVWVRPKDMFCEAVDIDGRRQQRFALVA
jgi:hypothetical protein